MDCLYFHLEKAFGLKTLIFCSLQRPWSHPAHTVYAYLASHQFFDRDHLEEHDAPAISPFIWSLQERLGLTTVGPGGERTHVQGPEVNADFLVIIFKIVKYHWACSLRCRLSGHWMDPGERYSPHMKLILRVHCHLRQKRKLNRRKRDPRRNQDDRILEHRIKPQKCKKNFKNVRHSGSELYENPFLENQGCTIQQTKVCSNPIGWVLTLLVVSFAV